MQSTDLAQRLAALDWSATSLEHQLAVSAAVETLGGAPMPVPYPHQVGSPYFDGAEAFECHQTFPLPASVMQCLHPTASNVVALPVAPRTRWTRLYDLKGNLWASSCHFGAEGAWGWVLETVAAEHGVSEDQISSLEGLDDDLVTIDGLPVYRLRHVAK